MLPFLRRNRLFRRLWAAQAMSRLGDRVLDGGLPFFVYLATGSAFATAASLAASLVLALVLSPVAGAFADRWDRASLLAMIFAIDAIALSALLFTDAIVAVYAVIVVTSLTNPFLGPARQAMVPDLVQRDEVIAANALNSMSDSTVGLVGPPLGGWLLSAVGLSALAAIDALSFVLAAILVLGLRTRQASANEPGADEVPSRVVARFWSHLASGAWRLRDTAALRPLAGCFTVLGLATSAYAVGIVPFIRDELHASSAVYGLLGGASAVGAIVGGWGAPRLAARLGEARVLAAGLAAAGVALGATAVQTGVPLVLGLAAVVGVAGALTNTAAHSLLQKAAPADMLGRIYGAIGGLAAASGLVGLTVGAAVVESSSARSVIASAGAVIVATVPLALRLPTQTSSTVSEDRLAPGDEDPQ